jgi:hypothetical protein
MINWIRPLFALAALTSVALCQTTPGADSATLSISGLPAGVTGAVTRTATLTLTVTASGTPLPLPWAADDIGPVTVAGSSALNNGTATIQAPGMRLYGNSDAFRFTYRALIGDGSMQIRATNWNTIWDTARLGVMIRDSLAPDALYALARFRADVIVGVWVATAPGVQSRTAYGAASTETGILPQKTCFSKQSVVRSPNAMRNILEKRMEIEPIGS